MGYLHIDNLYKPTAQDILLFRECYALEKIHGTSANIGFNAELSGGMQSITYFPGGVSRASFEGLVQPIVEAALIASDDSVEDSVIPNDIEFTVYGEAYGGSCQKMSNVYGKELRFVAFDVKIGDVWLSVPQAEEIVKALGLEFVDYVRIDTDMKLIDIERDKPSTQARRNGMGEQPREGVVLRPLIELVKNNGKRVIVKHKGEEYRETKTKREVSPAQLEKLSNAQDIAHEWVTYMRLTHVLDKLEGEKDMTIMPKLRVAMIEDIKREGEGEIEWSTEVGNAISKATAVAMRSYLANSIC